MIPERPPEPHGFCEYLRDHIGANWVLVPRVTDRLKRQYGDDVKALPKARYDRLKADYRALNGPATAGEALDAMTALRPLMGFARSQLGSLGRSERQHVESLIKAAADALAKVPGINTPRGGR